MLMKAKCKCYHCYCFKKTGYNKENYVLVLFQATLFAYTKIKRTPIWTFLKSAYGFQHNGTQLPVTVTLRCRCQKEACSSYFLIPTSVSP